MKAARSILLLVALLGQTACLFIRKHVYVDMDLNWTAAQAHCRAHFVDLSVIVTQTEYQKYMADTAKCNHQHCWIGLSKKGTDSDFTHWSDGRMLEFEKWNSGEPNDLNTELCANSNGGKWYNCGCEWSLKFSCYTWEPQMVLVQEMKTWLEALEHCRNLHTDLISLNTMDDLFGANQTSLSSETPKVWTGLRFLDGLWFWMNKEPLENLTNLPSCPTTPGHCGAKTVGEDTLENRDCEEKLNFICYKQ